MASSIFSRKRDLLYTLFFAIHIPVMFAVDLYPLYPASIRPLWMSDLRNYYITTYRDQFFSSPPAWFNAYIWMELLYHLPLCTWAIPALIRNDAKVPIHLLVYAVQTAITTMTCIADYLSWTNVTAEEKITLGYLYVPYLALSVFMGVDMFGRLDAVISGKTRENSKKTR